MPAELTPDEVAVLAHLAQGATGDAAARHLGISDRTLRRQCERIRERLGVATTTQAIVWAARRGLI